MARVPKRQLVVGDLHGSIEGLKQCLLDSNYNQAKDQLIFMGNYIGEYENAPYTIEFLLWLARTAVFYPIFIKGDIDNVVTIWLTEGKLSKYWMKSIVGKKTVNEYMKSSLLTKHDDFFEDLEDFYINDDNKAFVHAGFLHPSGLVAEKYTGVYYYNQTLWREAINDGRRYKIDSKGNPIEGLSYRYDELFIGHSSTTYSNYNEHSPELAMTDAAIGEPITIPMNRRNIWNVNTGVRQGFRLTIMDINSKNFWQSNTMSELYPIKK